MRRLPLIACRFALWLRAIALLAMVGALANPAWGQWQRIGPNYATVLSSAHQPGNDAVMLAGTYFGGLYRSTDHGFRWQPVATPFASASVFTVVFDRTQPQRVYAGLFEQGVWRSDDAGLTWTTASAGLPEGSVQALAVDPSSARVLAATVNGLYQSLNGGVTWTVLAGYGNAPARSLAFDPTRPGHLYVGTNGSGVRRSTDGGNTWVDLPNGSTMTTVGALSVDGNGRVYAAANEGVFSLQSGASTWVELRLNLPASNVNSVYAHPTVPNLVFAATSAGLWVLFNPEASGARWYQLNAEGTRFVTSDSGGFVLHYAGQIASFRLSLNFGATWADASAGMQTAFVGGLGVSSGAGGRRVLAGTDLGVMALDPGSGWTKPLPRQEAGFDIHVRGSAVYAGMETSGVWKSSDGGSTWTAASNGIVPTRIADLSFTLENPATLMAATASGAFRSSNGGVNWEPVRLPEVSFVHTVAADPVRPPIVFLGTSGGKVYRSIDGGKNFAFAGGNLPATEDIVRIRHAPWSTVYAISGSGKLFSTTDNGFSWYPAQKGCAGPVNDLVSEPVRHWVVYASTNGAGVCKSSSGGLDWTPVNVGIDNLFIQTLAIDRSNPQRVWAGGIGKVYRSTDGGATWLGLSGGLPAAAFRQIVQDPSNNDRLLALLVGQGLYESTDGGGSWQLRSGSDVVTGGLSLRIDPANSARWLVGTPHKGIQASTDGGANWVGANQGMSLFVRSLASDPADARTLYAGTFDGGVFRSKDAGASWATVGLSGDNVFRVRSPAANRVLVGAANGVAVSDDQGNNWFELGQRAAFAFTVAHDPANPQRMLVGTSAGVLWLSEDGRRWRQVGRGLPSSNISALITCAGKLFAVGENAGIWQNQWNTLGSNAWVRTDSGGIGSTQVAALSCDPRTGFLYAATNGQGLLLSFNGGGSWNPINVGHGRSIFSAVQPHPTQAWRVFAASPQGGVFESVNAGLNWTAISSGLPNVGVDQLVLAADGTVFVALDNGAVFKRSGSTWLAAGSGLPGASLSALHADPARSAVLMAGLGSQGVYITRNAGASWQRLPLDTSAAPAAAVAGGAQRWLVGTLGGALSWSIDDGASFSLLQPSQWMPQFVIDIGVDAVDPNTLYIGAGTQGVLISRDGGAHWQATAANFEVLILTPHPSRSGELYAGGHGGVFRSRDFGATWVALNDGLIGRNVTALHFDPFLADILYGGFEGAGAAFYDTRP